MPRSIRIEFAGDLYQKISEYGANSHKCQPDPLFRGVAPLREEIEKVKTRGGGIADFRFEIAE